MAKKKKSKKGKKASKPAGRQPAAGESFDSPSAGAMAASDAVAPSGGDLPESDPRGKPFLPEVLDRTVIAIPLLEKLRKDADATQPIIIDLHLEYPRGREAAMERVKSLVKQIQLDLRLDAKVYGLNLQKSVHSKQYLFGVLPGRAIVELVRRDIKTSDSQAGDGPPGAIYRIWPDFEVEALIFKSIATVKADAARNSFSAMGNGVVWAVMDSGIDGSHAHFRKHQNLVLDTSMGHRDFTVLEDGNPLEDEYGHGTHVAGILAGEARRGTAISRYRNEVGDIRQQKYTCENVYGMAAKCKLLSLKVLDNNGKGQVSSLIAALEYIQEINGNGRRLRVHGLNMSVGYNFEPEWFACGQSPLCVEVDRLVKSGVVVVVAAGNTGYGFHHSAFKGVMSAGMDQSINDPGNSDLAITVGSTHRDMPHVYGVSYFSSKGPTGDGRPKPDLVAPGEKIISCASSQHPDFGNQFGAEDHEAAYKEDSGTSMAAPHVSGAIAAFLSVRREFIGRPERVKEIFVDSATDLKRAASFQGRGLVDLMRAMQSV